MHKSINFIFSCSRLYFIFYILLKEGWGKTVHLSDKAITVRQPHGYPKQ